MPTAPKSHSQLRAQRTQKTVDKNIDKQRGTSTERGYGGSWPRMRQLMLHRQPLCVKCGAPGTDVDHIIPKRLGGQDIESNLQVLCKSCHSKKTANEDALPTVPTEIVVGPKGSGRRAYVDKHRKNGDLIVDLDALYQAVSGGTDKPKELLPYVIACQKAIYNRLCRPWKRYPQTRKAWIITAEPKRDKRTQLATELNASVTVLETSVSDCSYNLQQQGYDGGRYRELVAKAEKWWKDYERGEA